MRTFLQLSGGLLLAALLGGCGTFGSSSPAVAQPNSQRWFLDPSTEFGNYRTFGFVQVTAVRYEDPSDLRKRHGVWGKRPDTYEERRLATSHTDELIWRVLRDELQAKGYSQVQPADADVLVIYYGGPRPQLPPQGLRLQHQPFDAYFAQNEMQPQTFWVDIIDSKRNLLIYRGWDNETFGHDRADAARVIQATQQAVRFFPSRGW